MEAIGKTPDYGLFNFLVLMSNVTIKIFDHKSTLADAQVVADAATAKGFTSVVLDLNQLKQVYPATPVQISGSEAFPV